MSTEKPREANAEKSCVYELMMQAVEKSCLERTLNASLKQCQEVAVSETIPNFRAVILGNVFFFKGEINC